MMVYTYHIYIPYDGILSELLLKIKSGLYICYMTPSNLGCSTIDRSCVFTITQNYIVKKKEIILIL